MSNTTSLPSLFLNSVPKSGTHLLSQLVLGIPKFTICYPVIYQGLPRDFHTHTSLLAGRSPYSLYIGHVHYSNEWALKLRELKVRTIFMTRDLRDIVVSLAYYIANHVPNYPIYQQLIALKNQKDRYLLLINGTSGYPNIRTWFQLFSGWSTEPSLLQVNYESLMTTPERRQQTLLRIVNHIWQDIGPPIPFKNMIRMMEANVSHSNINFRKGTVGGWRDEFDEEVKNAFKRVAGDVLIQMGYEKSNNW